MTIYFMLLLMLLQYAFAYVIAICFCLCYCNMLLLMLLQYALWNVLAWICSCVDLFLRGFVLALNCSYLLNGSCREYMGASCLGFEFPGD